ncbi:MAG: DUF2304 domain-containing protein [Myxococcaceae bacterium]
MARSSLLVLLADALLAFVIVTTARKRRISERLMLGWLLVCALIASLAIWRPGIDRLAAALDIYYAPSALFAIAFAGLLLVVYRLSVELAEQKQRMRRLAQEIALLTAKSPAAGAPEKG